MYAVIETGGKQHRVREGQVIKIEKLEKGIGESVEFGNVLMVSSDKALKVGAPYVKGALVTAEVMDQARHPKIRILKFRRRKHHMKHQGHRQYYTAVKVTGIKA
jgi:large subunit ribosomal protein L21